MSADDRREWPIVVEYTIRHIVWAESETPEKAIRWVSGAPTEWTNNEDIVDTDVSITVPDKWDYQYSIYDVWHLGANHGPWAADRPQYYGADPKTGGQP